MLDAALGHQADVEGGSAHVGRDDVAETGGPGQVFARADTRDGTGVDGLQRVGRVHLRHAAGVVDDEHRLGVAGVAQVARELSERVEHDLVQEAVDDRRGGPDVLALAAGHLVPQQHRDGTEFVGRVLLEDELEDPQLVFGVLGRIDQGHDDGFCAVVDEFAHRLTDVVLVEGHHDLARGVDPLAHRADELAMDQRFGALRGRQVLLHGRIEALAVAAAARQRNRVLEAVGDEGPHPGAFALDERVRPEGGRIANGVDAGENLFAIEVCAAACEVEGLVEAQGEVVMSRQRLGLDVLVVPDEEAIGEGAADVDGDAFHCGGLLTSRAVSGGVLRRRLRRLRPARR